MPIKLFAIPMVMQGYRPQCQYCGGEDTYFEYLHNSVGLLSCDEHKELAKRDAQAWCAGEGLVRWRDGIQDPVFVEGGLLTWAGVEPQMNDLKVRRSSGAIEGGWELHPPTRSWIESNYVTRSKTTGRWSVQVIQKYSEVTRGLLVEDLKLTVPEAKWGLVDAFLARLEAGFYKAEHAAFQEAVAASAAAAAAAATAAGAVSVKDDVRRLMAANGQQRAEAIVAAKAEHALAKQAYHSLCMADGTLGDRLALSPEAAAAADAARLEAYRRMEHAGDVAFTLTDIVIMRL